MHEIASQVASQAAGWLVVQAAGLGASGLGRVLKHASNGAERLMSEMFSRLSAAAQEVLKDVAAGKKKPAEAQGELARQLQDLRGSEEVVRLLQEAASRHAEFHQSNHDESTGIQIQHNNRLVIRK